MVGNLLIHGAVDCRLGSTLYSPDVDTVENMMQKGLPRGTQGVEIERSFKECEVIHLIKGLLTAAMHEPMGPKVSLTCRARSVAITPGCRL